MARSTCLAWTVCVIDSYWFAKYGGFTSNQAGKRVVQGTDLPQIPQRAGLAAPSLVGAVVGVAVSTVIQRMLSNRR